MTAHDNKCAPPAPLSTVHGAECCAAMGNVQMCNYPVSKSHSSPPRLQGADFGRSDGQIFTILAENTANPLRERFPCGRYRASCANCRCQATARRCQIICRIILIRTSHIQFRCGLIRWPYGGRTPTSTTLSIRAWKWFIAK